MVIGNHCSRGGLLEHHFRYPNFVGLRGLSPREWAQVGPEPIEYCFLLNFLHALPMTSRDLFAMTDCYGKDLLHYIDVFMGRVELGQAQYDGMQL